MKRLVLALAGLCAAVAAFADVHDGFRLISTANNSLVIKAEPAQKLKTVYYGAALKEADLAVLEAGGLSGYETYPAYGSSGHSDYALAVRHADGNLSTDLVVESVSDWSDENGSGVKVRLKDPAYPLAVNVYFKAYNEADMISTWTEIENGGKKPVTLTEFDSGLFQFRARDIYVSHLYGTWANEGQLMCEKLNPAGLVIENRDGVRNTHTSHPEVMISLDGEPRENSGAVIGAALCYSGNYRLKFRTGDSGWHCFTAGIHPDNSWYILDSKEVFTTPELALTYSGEGLSGVSRNFHRWARKYKLAHGDVERKILLNSWEGVYFDIREDGMAQMMTDIASMGGELFVMDDGWFGGKYPRNNDSSSLGDWEVDKTKLPNGIEGLVKAAADRGIRFGLWIEPEMTNSVSVLFEEHPDWVLKAANRELVEGRGGTQLVLDLSNPEVQDFIFKVVDDLMTANPEIDYIKWDANADIRNFGSQYLPAEKQSHFYIEYHRGLESVCQRIRAKYPDLTIQACASGGGRANYGLLPYFDEFWVSDDTDALHRIYMQWGTSYFFPAIAMASHISAAPNHQTFRSLPLKFRIDVAMSGRLGMEIQPKNMTDEEKELCRNAIADYKKIRPIVQFGDIYRLQSPYDERGVASLMYCAEDKSEAAFFWWKTGKKYAEIYPKIKFAGLDPDKRYVITELNRVDLQPLPFEGKSFSGKFLMDEGLEIPSNNDVAYHLKFWESSRVLHLRAE